MTIRENYEQWLKDFAGDPETISELEAIRDSLYASGAVYASMSGSGSALFALYRKEGGRA